MLLLLQEEQEAIDASSTQLAGPIVNVMAGKLRLLCLDGLELQSDPMPAPIKRTPSGKVIHPPVPQDLDSNTVMPQSLSISQELNVGMPDPVLPISFSGSLPSLEGPVSMSLSNFNVTGDALSPYTMETLVGI